MWYEVQVLFHPMSIHFEKVQKVSLFLCDYFVKSSIFLPDQSYFLNKSWSLIWGIILQILLRDLHIPVHSAVSVVACGQFSFLQMPSETVEPCSLCGKGSERSVRGWLSLLQYLHRIVLARL